MGVRMAPRLGRRSRTAAYRVAPTSWLRRIDLLILPLVFAVDVLLFSRLLRTDDVDNATRVAIRSRSAATSVAWRALRHSSRVTTTTAS